jgi:phosphatidylglycerol:prolipoprotein diacylglycerol transferase
MFEIAGISFHWYGLLIGIGTWIAMEIALINPKKIQKTLLESSMWWTIAGGVVGARVYHVIDFWNQYYSANFSRIFYLWDGGLGIFGALAGGMMGLGAFCVFNKQKYWIMTDSLVVGIPLAQTIGRLGNWINGELIGKNGEPLFAIEGALNLALFLLLIFASEKNLKTGQLTGVYFLGYSVIRFFLEQMRPIEAIWMIGSIPTAQIFSLVFGVTGLWLIFRKKQS